MTEEAMRRLRLLGPACVDRIPRTQKDTAKSAGDERGAGAVPRFRSRRTVALLGYLVAVASFPARAGRCLTLDDMMDLFI